MYFVDRLKAQKIARIDNRVYWNRKLKRSESANMNAIDIALMANIGEIIAAVKFVVSLIYVALQVRQNTHTLQVTAAQS